MVLVVPQLQQCVGGGGAERRGGGGEPGTDGRQVHVRAAALTEEAGKGHARSGWLRVI